MRESCDREKGDREISPDIIPEITPKRSQNSGMV